MTITHRLQFYSSTNMIIPLQWCFSQACSRYPWLNFSKRQKHFYPRTTFSLQRMIQQFYPTESDQSFILWTLEFISKKLLYDLTTLSLDQTLVMFRKFQVFQILGRKLNAWNEGQKSKSLSEGCNNKYLNE